jgi:hypothetical protein
MVGMLLLTIVSTACCKGAKKAAREQLQKEWMQKSEKACKRTAKLIKKLQWNTAKFENVLDAEIEKTKKGGRSLKTYNPDLFRRLSKALEPIDVTNPEVKDKLNKDVWMTHYRFVNNAGELLPRLHSFLALLAQLKFVVGLGLAVDRKHAKQLNKMLPDAKTPKMQKKPMFGVVIQENFGVIFTGELGKPVRRKDTGAKRKCVETQPDLAEGYRLSDGRCYWFSRAPQGRGKCTPYNNTLRYFQNTDAELFNRLKCTGIEMVYFESWLYNVIQIQHLLHEISKVNPKNLYHEFRNSTAVASDPDK